MDRWDMPRRDDGSSQKTDRGDSASHASIYVSPNLCPGLPFIRSIRGSSYGEVGTIETLGIDICSLIARESLVDSVRAQFL